MSSLRPKTRQRFPRCFFIFLLHPSMCKHMYKLMMCLFWSLLPNGSVQAHNGSVALATPVSELVVDGDLTDWPEGMTRYPVRLPEFGDRPRDQADLNAHFRIGYNLDESALYVAVEVRDESVFIDEFGGGPYQDGSLFFEYRNPISRSFTIKVGEVNPGDIDTAIWPTST